MVAKLNYMKKSLPMKHKNLFKWLVAGLVLTISAITTESYSQTKTRKLHHSISLTKSYLTCIITLAWRLEVSRKPG